MSSTPTTKMPSKRRKAQILHVATELFAELGYDGTSLRDVAEKCGMTKAALYYHFADKEALLRAVVEFRMTRLCELAEAAIATASPDSPQDRIRAFVRASARHIDNDRAGWLVGSRIFWSIGSKTDRSALVTLRDRYEGLLRNEIEKGIAMGEFISGDAGMLTRMILGWLNYIPRWHRLDGPSTAEAVADSYLDVTLNGMRVR